MGRYLAMYDLSGIQDFIFQTNRLKEIAGASYLVSQALFSNVPKLAGEEPDAWKTRGPDGFKGLGENDARVVYVGGGNALVLFGSDRRAYEFTKNLKRMVFAQTGGSLRICSACVEVGETERLYECFSLDNPDGLFARLDRSKARAPQCLTARGFSIDSLDNESKEPILFFESRLDDRGERRHFMPRGMRLKLEAYYDQHGFKRSRAYTSPLIDVMRGRKFEVEFERFFVEDGQRSEGKHFLAIEHIDGNTMGQRIAGFLASLKERDQSLECDLAAMRDLSVCIGDSYRKALETMITRVCGEPDEQRTLPFRPIISDGDDITFICRADKAFECLTEFVGALREPDAEVPARKDLPTPADFSVGAGIAFVHESYPFSSAYEIAESLCKNAKATTLERNGRDIEFTGECGAGTQPPISSVDFHVCTGELTGGVAHFRRNHMKWMEMVGDQAKEIRLCKRPYHLDARSLGEVDFTLGSFLATLAEFKERSKGEHAWIARSKLKGLRDKYGQGYLHATRYGEFIVERDVSMLKSNPSKEEAERRDFIVRFNRVYVEGADAVYAQFFDVLDVIDVIGGAQ